MPLPEVLSDAFTPTPALLIVVEDVRDGLGAGEIDIRRRAGGAALDRDRAEREALPAVERGDQRGAESGEDRRAGRSLPVPRAFDAQVRGGLGVVRCGDRERAVRRWSGRSDEFRSAPASDLGRDFARAGGVDRIDHVADGLLARQRDVDGRAIGRRVMSKSAAAAGGADAAAVVELRKARLAPRKLMSVPVIEFDADVGDESQVLGGVPVADVLDDQVAGRSCRSGRSITSLSPSIDARTEMSRFVLIFLTTSSSVTAAVVSMTAVAPLRSVILKMPASHARAAVEIGQRRSAGSARRRPSRS